jgi:peroxisomal membrane protein 4
MDVLKVCSSSLIAAALQLTTSQETVESIILNPDLAPLLAIVKAARNGAVYGAKVRFPHALVMVFIFRSGTFKEKLRLVYKATKQHARNLAFFATVYKSSMLILRLLNPSRPGKEGPYDTFFAGALGGYVVFGRGKNAR